MPAFSEMDCDKGSEEQNEYQQLLERNNNLEREIKRMKSDFIILKQKIICTDTLIKKVQEKHKYCEILERKYFELKKIIDASKRECEVHTVEYQGILLKFGPLKQEKEMLECKCNQLKDEVDQLKNSIRCYEVIQNQMKEASKKQLQDFENYRKENKLLQSKLIKMKQVFKNSEKKQATILEKKQKKKDVPKNAVSNITEEEEEISLREMAHNIEAQFANGDVTESDLKLKSKIAVNKAKRKVPRKIKSTKGKTKKLYSINSVKKAKRRGMKSVQDVSVISRWKGKKKSNSINKQIAGVVDNITNSVKGQIDSYPQNSDKSPYAEGEPNDQHSNNDSERRLALLYEDLMISSDDDDLESNAIQNEPYCNLNTNSPTPIIASIATSDIYNLDANLFNEKDLISCKEGKSAPEVLMSQENEESHEVVQKICSSVKEILDDAGIILTSNDTEESHDQTNHLQNDVDLPHLPVSPQESNTVSCKANETIDPILVSFCDSRNVSTTTEKSISCVSVEQLDMEIASPMKEVEILNHAKENRKRKNSNSSSNADHNIPISFKKFEELDIEDVLNLVSIARPLSPLANRNTSLKLLENSKKHDIVDKVNQIPNNQLNLPKCSSLDYISTSFKDISKSFLSHSCRGSISNCTLNHNEYPQMLRDVYHNLLRLVKCNRQPLSPFLFEARNLKISGLPFVRIIMKIIQKSSINVIRFWSENQSLIDTPHNQPWLPPSFVRLIEILVSCGTSLDQGKATLELFMVNSFALIIYYHWGERLTKYKEVFISCLSCCVVAILRIQGNMERVRMLLYEVIRNSCASSRIGTVVMTICAVWPQCLMLSKVEKHRFSCVQQVLRYYVTNSFKCQDTETRFVKQLCGWEKVEQSPDEVISKLFQQIEHFFSQDSISQDVVSMTSWEMQTAVMLLCTKEGWSWTSAMVSKFLWPFLGAWGNGNSTSDHFVQLVIDLLGICLSQYLEKIDPANYNNIFDNLKLLVMQTSVSLNIREAALRSVLRLSHHSSFPCQLVPFIGQHRSLFAEETHVLLGLLNI